MAILDNDLIKIGGCVEGVLYYNENNGYIVLELSTSDDYITVAGELGKIDEGEELLITGKFVNHNKYGRQFNAQVCERRLPETATSIYKYLAAGAIKGIGPTMAKKLVEQFGSDTLNIIEASPQSLVKIKGISIAKAEEISQSYRQINGVRTLMMFLGKYNISPSYAVIAWKRWGQFAVEMIKSNPYVLCDSGISLSFLEAQQMADEMGHSRNSDGRILAGISYILEHNTLNGHTCLPYSKLKETALKLLEVEEEAFDNSLEANIEENYFAEYYKNDDKERRFIFLKEYFDAQQYIVTRLRLMKSFFKDNEVNYTSLIEVEEKTKSITYADKQKEAISKALSTGFLILTGGPGTGKTTTLNAIVSLFKQRGLSVMICAPTGRAAKRIADLTNYPAKTIHRLLEVEYDSLGNTRFKHNEQNQLDCDVVIVDEMSMVDTLLFEALLRALKLSCRLIMVGDSDQLPSVAAGNVLKDMLDSDRLAKVKLTEIFRQAQESCIVTNAHKIVAGIQPDLTKKDNDFFFLQRLNSSDVANTVTELVSKRLPVAYEYSPLEDIQVLCPSRKGPLGSIEMNKSLQLILNPVKKSLNEIRGMLFTFRENDKVMQTKNNYDIIWKRGVEKGTGIFNGDIGYIESINMYDKTLIINFDGRIACYTFEMLEQIELAYAITVHKSQGSEFNAVILPLLSGYDKLCYRNLLYTAVTRAKKMLIIVGSMRVVEQMVNNDRRTNRYTCLKEMLEGEL